ncbi:MAG TPA: hypothetical protein VMX17_09100 [Candidatus Glassbacteria bacterium]|nr:hypothetical protein [Candidatus Glassbacteria bacterium]
MGVGLLTDLFLDLALLNLVAIFREVGLLLKSLVLTVQASVAIHELQELTMEWMS